MNTVRLHRAAKVGATSAVCDVLLTGGLAACGQAAAKVSTKHQFGAAQSSLKNATSASFTVHLDDPNKELAAAVSSASDKQDMERIENASLKVTVDPEGNQTIGSVSPPSPKDAVKALKESGAVEITNAVKGADVFSLRPVAGVLYLRVLPAGVQAATGRSLTALAADFGDPSKLAGDPVKDAAAAAKTFEAGQWLKLDLPELAGKDPEAAKLNRAAGLAQSGTVLDAVQNHATFSTTKNGNTSVVSMKIDAKAALSAVASALKNTPLADDASVLLPASELAAIPAGTVSGSITSTDSHVTRADLDLGSVAALSTEPDVKGIKTAKLVVDINDHAAPVTSPTPDKISTIDASNLVLDTLFATIGAPS